MLKLKESIKHICTYCSEFECKDDSDHLSLESQGFCKRKQITFKLKEFKEKIGSCAYITGEQDYGLSELIQKHKDNDQHLALIEKTIEMFRLMLWSSNDKNAHPFIKRNTVDKVDYLKDQIKVYRNQISKD